MKSSYQEGKQWEKGDELDKGTAGVVFKATDCTSKHEFAVKEVSHIAVAAILFVPVSVVFSTRMAGGPVTLNMTVVTVVTVKTVCGGDAVKTVCSGDTVKTVCSGDTVMTVCSGDTVMTVCSGDTVMTVCSGDTVMITHNGDSIMTAQ